MNLHDNSPLLQPRKKRPLVIEDLPDDELPTSNSQKDPTLLADNDLFPPIFDHSTADIDISVDPDQMLDLLDEGNVAPKKKKALPRKRIQLPKKKKVIEKVPDVPPADVLNVLSDEPLKIKIPARKRRIERKS